MEVVVSCASYSAKARSIPGGVRRFLLRGHQIRHDSLVVGACVEWVFPCGTLRNQAVAIQLRLGPPANNRQNDDRNDYPRHWCRRKGSSPRTSSVVISKFGSICTWQKERAQQCNGRLGNCSNAGTSEDDSTLASTFDRLSRSAIHRPRFPHLISSTKAISIEAPIGELDNRRFTWLRPRCKRLCFIR